MADRHPGNIAEAGSDLGRPTVPPLVGEDAEGVLGIGHDVVVKDELVQILIVRTIAEEVLFVRGVVVPLRVITDLIRDLACRIPSDRGVVAQIVVIDVRVVVAVEQIQHDELAVELSVELRLLGGEILIAEILIEEGAGGELREHVGQDHVEHDCDERGEHDRRNDDGHRLHEYAALALLAKRNAHHHDDEHQAQHAREDDADEGPEGIVRHQLVRLDAEHRRKDDDERQAQDVEQNFEDCESRDLAGIGFFVFSISVFHFTAPPCRYFLRQVGRRPPRERRSPSLAPPPLRRQ